jgi:predicted amidophosphoribosyltransferase
MGVIDSLRRLWKAGSGPSLGSDDENEGPYVCGRCQASLDRPYRECPECGSPFVGRVEDSE